MCSRLDGVLSNLVERVSHGRMVGTRWSFKFPPYAGHSMISVISQKQKCQSSSLPAVQQFHLSKGGSHPLLNLYSRPPTNPQEERESRNTIVDCFQTLYRQKTRVTSRKSQYRTDWRDPQ